MNKDFYTIRMNTEPENIGVSNGIKQANIKKEGFSNQHDYNELMRLLGSREYWENRHLINSMRFNVECIELLPKAILTDFLLFGPVLINCEYAISERVVEILRRFHIHKGSWFPASVIDQRAISHPYWVIHLETMDDSVIDFSKSLFYTGWNPEEKNLIRFENIREKEDFSKTSILKIHSLSFNDSFDDSIDMFTIKNHGETIISERLKRELTASRATGPIYMPAWAS